MAAIFIASMANNDLPRNVVAAMAMTGSLLSGLGREAPAQYHRLRITARPRSADAWSGRQSVSKLTNQTSFGATKTPRPLRSTFHATSPDAIVYVVLLQPGALCRIDENQSPFFDTGHDQYSFYRDRCMRDLCRRHAGPCRH